MLASSFFFFNDTATTEIYTLSLHDALPISLQMAIGLAEAHARTVVHRDIKPSNVIITPQNVAKIVDFGLDRKSTRLNSSHSQISYAVFCLKKKKKTT